MVELNIEYININDLVLYKNNAKEHPEEQIEQIKMSIEQFGMNDPIAIGKDNIIIEGHGRLLACKELGYEQVPIIRLDHLDEEQRKAYTLVHNKLTMNSDFDIDILNSELDNILNIDMSDFGFNLDFDEEENEIDRKDLSNNIFEKYEIIINCENELDLKQKFEKLEGEGYECRISTL